MNENLNKLCKQCSKPCEIFNYYDIENVDVDVVRHISLFSDEKLFLCKNCNYFLITRIDTSNNDHNVEGFILDNSLAAIYKGEAFFEQNGMVKHITVINSDSTIVTKDDLRKLKSLIKSFILF